MRKGAGVAVAFAVLFAATPSFSATAYNWLCGQQQSTGLVDSYEGDDSSIAYTYDQALSVIAFVLSGDVTRAKRVLNRMVAIQNTEGSWDDAYYADTAAPVSTWRLGGNSSWMIMAINYFTYATGDRSYLSAAQKCADWLLQFQDMDAAGDRYGSVSGGLADNGTVLTWVSTEHNYDAYSALKYLGALLNKQTYKDRAALVYAWVANKMWDNTAGRFYTGYNDYSVYLDPQSWAVASLGATGPSGQDFRRAISWAYNNMRLTRTYNSKTIEGFDYDGSVNGIWFEGTGQMALAYELTGDGTKSAYFRGQAGKAQSANGGILTAVGDGSIAWPTNFPYNGVAATGWYIFCSTSPKLNPFQPPSRDIAAPLISGVAASKIAISSVTVSWTTNENSDTRVEYGTSTLYGAAVVSTAPVKSHAIVLKSLTSGTTYHFRVSSKDAAGNRTVSGDYKFATAGLTISKVGATNIKTSGATITWTTSAPGTTQVEYGKTAAYGSSTALSTTLVSTHTVTLGGLASATVYHYRVKSADAAKREVISGDYTFTTASVIKDYYADSVKFLKGTSTGNYADLKTNNAVYMSVKAALSGSQYITDWYAQKTIGYTSGTVAKLTVTYDGHYSASRTQQLYLYNYTTAAWDRIDSRTVSTADRTISYATVATSRYISSSRQIQLRVRATGSSAFTCYADFVRFRVQLKSGAVGAPSLAGEEIDDGVLVDEEEADEAAEVALPDAAPAEDVSGCKLYDNLFNPGRNERARIDLGIGSDGRAAVRIYNLAGELVRTLIDETRTSGNYIDYWDGKNDGGETVASGVYLIHVDAPGIKTTKKAAVIK